MTTWTFSFPIEIIHTPEFCISFRQTFKKLHDRFSHPFFPDNLLYKYTEAAEIPSGCNLDHWAD